MLHQRPSRLNRSEVHHVSYYLDTEGNESFSIVKSRGSARAAWLKRTTMASADAADGSPTLSRGFVLRGACREIVGGTERMRRKDQEEMQPLSWRSGRREVVVAPGICSAVCSQAWPRPGSSADGASLAAQQRDGSRSDELSKAGPTAGPLSNLVPPVAADIGCCCDGFTHEITMSIARSSATTVACRRSPSVANVAITRNRHSSLPQRAAATRRVDFSGRLAPNLRSSTSVCSNSHRQHRRR
jgi:hypothetical protein